VIICGICGEKIYPQIKRLEKIRIKSAREKKSSLILLISGKKINT
jgi:hypothetical protein